ncbi:MAG: glycosyltransferase family 4 protein [Terriglobales bacterium]
MLRINIVVPKLSADVFSGGIYCILEYAHGLVKRGHDVTIVPTAPSPYPAWFQPPIGRVITASMKDGIQKALKSSARAAWSTISRSSSSKSLIREATTSVCLLHPGSFSDAIRLGIAEAYLTRIAPEADVTLATSFETARPASLITGRKFYFAQHYEPYFSAEYADPAYVTTVARQSYELGFEMIANSSWLQSKLQSELGVSVALCPNAIDHKIFNAEPKPPGSSRKVIVISYGGRDAVWKGFREMAEAVAIARAKLSEYELEWRVYGRALVPPGEITPYVSLGFLSPLRLSEEYKKADILLSASWYESFPLFPIEAMASGLAVITTQLGTEEYAFHGRTAEVVQPRNSGSIAEGLVKLVRDPDYRSRIATGGKQISREFQWDKSVERFERILLNDGSGDHAQA